MNRVETIGNALIYLGDCREIMTTLPRVDAVVTDPPYGNGTEYGIYNDTRESLEDLIDKFLPWTLANSDRTLITCGNGCQYLYPRPQWTLAWIIPAGIGLGPWGFICWQPILAYGKCPYLASRRGGRPDIIVHTESSEYNGHPCPKPIRFMRKLVERSSLEGQTILDPFMGSGTTGVATISLGRKFIGIEIEPKYFDISCRRIEEETRQGDMFFEKTTEYVQGELLCHASGL